MNRQQHPSARAYGVLLHLYPADFKQRFREQMMLDFEDGLTDARRTGVVECARFLTRESLDSFLSIVERWMRSGKLVVGGAALCVTGGLWGALMLVAAFEWPGTNRPLGRQWPPTWPPSPMSKALLPMLTDAEAALALFAAAVLVTILAVMVLSYWFLFPALRPRDRAAATSRASIRARSR